MKLLNDFKHSYNSLTYDDVKQVPFLYWVEPLEIELVLVHGSLGNWTTENSENTEKREKIIMVQNECTMGM